MRTIGGPIGNALLYGLIGLLSLTLFLTGFEEGINVYLGDIAWYIKVLVGIALAYFIGKKLI